MSVSPAGPDSADGKYVCLVWHEFSVEQREAALVRLQQKLSRYAFPRLACILKIHGGIKFVGSYRELAKLAGVLNAQARQNEYHALLKDLSERIRETYAPNYYFPEESLGEAFSWLPEEERCGVIALIKGKREEVRYIASCVNADWVAALEIARESVYTTKERFQKVADEAVNVTLKRMLAAKRFADAEKYLAEAHLVTSQFRQQELEEKNYRQRLLNAREQALMALSKGQYALATQCLSWDISRNSVWLEEAAVKQATKQLYEDLRQKKDEQDVRSRLEGIRPYINDKTAAAFSDTINRFLVARQKVKFIKALRREEIDDAIFFARDSSLPANWLRKTAVSLCEERIDAHLKGSRFEAAYRLIGQARYLVPAERVRAWEGNLRALHREFLLKRADQLADDGDVARLVELGIAERLLTPAELAPKLEAAASIAVANFLSDDRYQPAWEMLDFYRKSLSSSFLSSQEEKIAEHECRHWLKGLRQTISGRSSLVTIQARLRDYPRPPRGIEEDQWSEFLDLVESAKTPGAEDDIRDQIAALERLAGNASEATRRLDVSEQWQSLKHRILSSVRSCLIEAHLGTPLEKNDWNNFDRRLLGLSLDSAEREDWLARKAQAIAELLRPALPLDSAQARVLASPAKTIRVTARAGSGKTGILRALAFFLIDQCGYHQNEVLLLAFNRRNAEELERHLVSLLKVSAFPTARTFHALANGIAQPEEKVLANQGDEVQEQELTRCVQEILRSQSNEALRKKIHQLFRGSSADKTYDALLSGKARYDYRRALKKYTLGGYLVKSAGEKYIGDFLFEHGIKHFYEDFFWWNGGLYRPDFKIPLEDKKYVIWEHWAISPDEEFYSGPDDWSDEKVLNYRAAAKRKREFWRNKKIELIETCAADCANREAFEKKIAALLRPYFPRLSRLPEEELYKQIQEFHFSRLAQWLVQGIQRSQKRGWDSAALAERLKRHQPDSEREKVFLELLLNVFTAYEPKLAIENRTDFDRLFNRAIEILKADPTRAIMRAKQTSIDLRRLRFCLVDEAQDLSPQFLEALVCLRALNPSLRILMVGDDWQAINRFAGSDVELFTGTVTTRLGNCATPNLTTNYRSAGNVVEAGNLLMDGQGERAVAHHKSDGSIEMAFLDDVWIDTREGSQLSEAEKPFSGYRGRVGQLLKAIYQLSIGDLNDGRSIGVIFRTNQSQGYKIADLHRSFLRIIRQFRWPKSDVDLWQRERIRFSTAHKFKGGECDTVFVVEPHVGAFPLLNADGIELFRFFGETLAQAEADERRLFYVAVTRAKGRLVFLAEKARNVDESPYLDDMREMIVPIQVPKVSVVPKYRPNGEAELDEDQGPDGGQDIEPVDESVPF